MSSISCKLVLILFHNYTNYTVNHTYCFLPQMHKFLFCCAFYKPFQQRTNHILYKRQLFFLHTWTILMFRQTSSKCTWMFAWSDSLHCPELKWYVWNIKCISAYISIMMFSENILSKLDKYVIKISYMFNIYNQINFWLHEKICFN